ncbi:unnamed protein product [Rhodiola kirilowii]
MNPYRSQTCSSCIRFCRSVVADFTLSDAEEKLTELERVESEVLHGEVLGFSSRSGLPNLYGSTVTLETVTLEPSSQWSCT